MHRRQFCIGFDQPDETHSSQKLDVLPRSQSEITRSIRWREKTITEVKPHVNRASVIRLRRENCMKYRKKRLPSSYNIWITADRHNHPSVSNPQIVTLGIKHEKKLCFMSASSSQASPGAPSTRGQMMSDHICLCVGEKKNG